MDTRLHEHSSLRVLDPFVGVGPGPVASPEYDAP